jgi:ABC-type uncharacterized transport system auxiliary subunit
MNTVSRITRLMLATALAAGLAGCNHLEDNVTQYVQRTDKVTVSAGNAKDANAAIHIIDPWPRASADRRIPANGERMAGAHERYRNVEKVVPLPKINPPNVTPSTGGATATAGGGAGGR